jgi:hypothetical protein
MKGKYSWSESPSDEIWMHDRFDTIEDCIKDAVENYEKKPGDQIAVGICEDYVPHVDVGTLLDRANEDAYEECGEVAEGWPAFLRRKGYVDEDKLQEMMDKVFNEWLEETHQVPGFYHINPLADMVTIPGGEEK